ncbi:c855e69f-f7ab-45ad-8a92-03ea2a452abd [Sclerotinia trifoliorum]|uniref:protein-L-isoaspartate(D-aspartate) O-methyltransferase n=1 Tax=Sclerotinia trifoliorum TaxID=28548 RepID=A0A8H2VQW2_9HELO|nr:c855e69f-f7ab-45ad-8a92-03ea2a452abd [Sclerotinia trifoliorum]
MKIPKLTTHSLTFLIPILIFHQTDPTNAILQVSTKITLSPINLLTYLPRFAHINDTEARQEITHHNTMAWTCSGRSNGELISKMWNARLILSERVRDAMISVDRAHFTPSQHLAYEDSPQSIGYSATISAPHMHASALENLLPFLGEGKRVLDVGSGSGYLTAVMAELVFPSTSSSSSDTSSERPGDVKKKSGKVVGLEHIRALRNIGETNMMKSEKGRKWLQEKKVEFVVGDGRQGWIDPDGEEGWDAIHVGAAAMEIHEALIQQLRCPGRMFIPVEDSKGLGQYIWLVDKDREGKVSEEKLYGVRYVPLTDAPRTISDL